MKNLSKYVAIASTAGILLLSVGFISAESPDVGSGGNLRKEAQMKAQHTSEQVQKLRDEAQVKVKGLRDDLKTKIVRIKDEKKQELARKIANQMQNLNQVWTNRFVDVLGRLDGVVVKIKSRSEKVLANGSDVSSVTTALQKAEIAIATARTAVASQAQKTYVVDTSSVTQNTSTATGQNNLIVALRTKFKEMKEQLHKDLTALRDGVIKDARTSVHEALDALSKVPNVDKEPVSNTNNQ